MHVKRCAPDAIVAHYNRQLDGGMSDDVMTLYIPNARHVTCLLRRQVDGSSMPLLGNAKDDDMRLIAEMTISRLQAVCSAAAAAAPASQITGLHQSKSVHTQPASDALSVYIRCRAGVCDHVDVCVRCAGFRHKLNKPHSPHRHHEKYDFLLIKFIRRCNVM